VGDSIDPPGVSAVRVDAAGIVRLKWVSGVRITAELARAAMDAVDAVNAGRPRPLLVEMTGAAGVTRGARTTFAGQCAVSRLALLGGSPVDRVLASSALGASAPAMPTRFFTSEDAALAWLERAGPPTGG
jgi:hypothetical protein